MSDEMKSGEARVNATGDKKKGGGASGGLSGAKAWLNTGRARLQARDAEGATECAQKGLDVLGKDYTSPTAVDDTEMAILMAKYQISRGNAEQGAQSLLDILAERIGSYERLHGERAAQSEE
jgi:hypothetical protein